MEIKLKRLENGTDKTYYITVRCARHCVEQKSFNLT